MATADAWEQRYKLLLKYTHEWKVRDDLKVIANGCDRNVELRLGQRTNEPPGSLHRWSWRTTQRNVSTMRELAEALLVACDFVEQTNPTWAKARLP